MASFTKTQRERRPGCRNVPVTRYALTCRPTLEESTLKKCVRVKVLLNVLCFGTVMTAILSPKDPISTSIAIKHRCCVSVNEAWRHIQLWVSFRNLRGWCCRWTMSITACVLDMPTTTSLPTSLTTLTMMLNQWKRLTSVARWGHVEQERRAKWSVSHRHRFWWTQSVAARAKRRARRHWALTTSVISSKRCGTATEPCTWFTATKRGQKPLLIDTSLNNNDSVLWIWNTTGGGDRRLIRSLKWWLQWKRFDYLFY